MQVWCRLRAKATHCKEGYQAKSHLFTDMRKAHENSEERMRIRGR